MSKLRTLLGTMAMRVQVAFGLSLFLGVHAAAGVPSQASNTTTTVIILRHAERLSDDKDTPLSKAGQARAKALVPLLLAMKPDVVIVSELQRTRQTVAPFLEKTKLVPLVRSNEKCAELAAEIFREWRGKTVLVVWHRGPHVELAKLLGAKEPFPEWKPDTYDRYWVITVKANGEVSLVEKLSTSNQGADDFVARQMNPSSR